MRRTAPLNGPHGSIEPDLLKCADERLHVDDTRGCGQLALAVHHLVLGYAARRAVQIDGDDVLRCERHDVRRRVAGVKQWPRGEIAMVAEVAGTRMLSRFMISRTSATE